MIGLEPGQVRLAHVHQEAVEDFNLAASEIAAVIGVGAKIEHVGSTSIPLLAAKPIVDIALGWVKEGTRDKMLDALMGIGYRYRGFREDAGGHIAEYIVGGRTMRHVHLLACESVQWRRYLAMREFLRCNSSQRDAYGAFKMELAVEFANERRAYTAAKRDFVEAMGDQACAWLVTPAALA